MKLKIFTVYDSKTECYLPPFYNHNTGAALRSFEESARQEDHPFHKYPADFTLFEIGTFDDQDCTVQTHDAKINLGCAIEYHGYNQPIEVVQ